MFVGTTPKEVQILIKKIIEGSKHENVFIGCSGNFTVDRLSSVMEKNVYSNDVALYSKLVANILLPDSEDFPVTVQNQELKKVFDTWPESKYKDFIQVLFCIKVSDYHQRKNDYQREMWNIYMSQSLDYYTRTIEKFEKNKVFDFKIKDFFYGYFVEHIKKSLGNGIGILFPPTYKGGYEKLFEFVDNTFSYKKPEYNLFDPKEANELFLNFLDNGENIIYTDIEREPLEEYLKGLVSLGVGKHDIYIYSSVKQSKKYYVRKTKSKDLTSLKLIPQDYVFTTESKISVREVSPNVINHYKSLFMALKVDYSLGGDNGLIFLADDMVFGFAAFSLRLSDEERCFLHSDFVVPSKERRLSKLMLYLLKSEDVRDFLVEKFNYFFDGLKTTVYSNKPVSMKYRGAFKLQRRDKGKLIYCGDFNKLKIKKNYQEWLKKTRKL